MLKDTLEELFLKAKQSGLDVKSVIMSDHGNATASISSLLYKELGEIQLDSNLNYPLHLYRFTGFPKYKSGNYKTKPIIDDIKNEAITFSNPNNFNDPMDPILKEWIFVKKLENLSDCERKILGNLLDTLGKMRISCMSNTSNGESNLNNPIMWSHYADMHKGICVEYEITQDMIEAYNDDNRVLRVNKIRYRDYKVMSDYIHFDNALLAKGSDWNYEQETRLIYFDKEESCISNYKSLGGFRIKSIYLGKRISDENKEKVMRVAKARCIDVYQMVYDKCDITKLAVGQKLV